MYCLRPEIHDPDLGYPGCSVEGQGLYPSLKTARNYVSNIFTKLQVADREQAIVRAREAGLGTNERQT